MRIREGYVTNGLYCIVEHNIETIIKSRRIKGCFSVGHINYLRIDLLKYDSHQDTYKFLNT